MNELLQPECDQDLPPSPSVSAVLPVFNVMLVHRSRFFSREKNACIQTQVRIKTTVIVIIICKFYGFCYHYYGYFLIGSQVRPSVRSVGIQCYFGDDKSLTNTGVHVQCSLLSTFQGISEEYELQMSQCSYDQPGDLDRSGYTVADESSL